MSKNTAIEIFLRVRPTKRPYGGMSNLIPLVMLIPSSTSA